MYELSKEKLISFIDQIYSLKRVIINDINNMPIVKINSIEKKDGFYYIKGLIKITLSPIYKEETVFRVKAKTSKKEIIMWTKQVSDWNDESMEKGEELKTIDTFKVHDVNGRKYLSHSTSNELKDLFILESGYSLRDGFSKKLKKVDKEKLDSNPEEKQKPSNFLKRRIKLFRNK